MCPYIIKETQQISMYRNLRQKENKLAYTKKHKKNTFNVRSIK